MTLVLDAVLVGLAIAVLAWGFERYRSRFIKADLLIAGTIVLGLLLLVIAPRVFDSVGNFLSINSRFTVVSLLANVTLLAFVLFLISKIRGIREDLGQLTRNLSVEQAPDAVQADGGQDLINVVIPAYNEEATIRSVLDSLPDTVRNHRVEPIVVSDGSGDATAQRAACDESIVVEHPLNQGQGGALQTGFEIALQNGASIVVTMDADGQHPADEMERLVSPIIDDEADYVMGSRYKGQNLTGNGYTRETGIRVFTRIINFLTKSDISDCTNGYRAIRGSDLSKLKLTEERFSAPELIIEARKNELRLKEIPITIEERQAGETKKPKLGYAAGLTRTILATWIR
jgi:hypothetical protein